MSQEMEFVEEAASVIRELTSFRDELLKRLTNMHLEENLLEESVIDTGKVEGSGIAAKQRLLRETIIDNSDMELIQRRLHQGREAFKATFPDLATNMTSPTEEEIHKEIAIKLNEVRTAGTEISKRVSVLDALQDRLKELQASLQQVQWGNRDLAAILENSREKTEQMQNDVQNNSEARETYEKLDKVVKELSLRKSAFQSLIHASQVDWFQDPDLLDLMVSLGEPVNL